MNMPWFRVYSEILNDKKIKRIQRNTGFSKLFIIGAWTSLLALANESAERGKLLISENIPYTISDISVEFEEPEENIKRLIDEFRLMNMLDGNEFFEIKNWINRQFKSDNSSERVKKHRETLQDEEAKRFSNVIEEDTDTEQIRTDKDGETERLSSLVKLYEDCVGPITGPAHDSILLAVDEYPYDWIDDAIRQCAKYNKRSWAYAESILKRRYHDGDKKEPTKTVEHGPVTIMLPGGQLAEAMR